MSRLHFIRQAQQCGFTLAEIRELLVLPEEPSACCSDVRAIAISKKAALEAKIELMKTMSAELDRLIGNCVEETLPLDDCPILNAFKGLPGPPAAVDKRAGRTTIFMGSVERPRPRRRTTRGRAFFELPLRKFARLDNSEGKQYGYLWTEVEDDAGQRVPVVTYKVPRPAAEGKPGRRYFEMIREGARQRGLPADYTAALDRVETRE